MPVNPDDPVSFLADMLDALERGIKVRNAVMCDFCQAPADLLLCGTYQCQANPCHIGTGSLFVDLSEKLCREVNK
jgi:hypothetical protein